MKILVVTNMYPSDKDPVYGTFVKSFVDGLNERNVDGTCELVAIRGKKYGILAKLGAYLRFYSSLTAKLMFGKYDLVYVHTITFPILPIRFVSLFRNLPLVFNVHGDDVLPGTRLKKWLKRLAAAVLPTAKMIVSPSDYFKKVVEREFPEVDPERIFVSPSGGVDDKFFMSRQRDFSSERPLILGYVSRIDEGKGWKLLVQAVSELVTMGVDCRCIMAGRGAQSAQLEALIEEMGLTDRVNYLGAVSRSSLPALYSSFDLFVFPTEREAESLGLVGIEAMATGTPVIAGNIGGPAGYVVDGVNGYLFTPGSRDDLVAKIHKYQSLSPTQKQSLSTGANLTAVPYRSKNVHDNLYQKLLSVGKV